MEIIPKEYPFIAGSPSKPQTQWLGFDTLEKAQAHVELMNVVVDKTYDIGTNWNKDYWPTKPLPWVCCAK